MGPTHHAIEDYGVLLCLPNISAYVPVFDQDIASVVERAGASERAVYLRLGRGEIPAGYEPPPYSPWRQLTYGGGPVVIAVGPLAGVYIETFQNLKPKLRPNLWALAELPLGQNPMPTELKDQIFDSTILCVVEEHVQRGSFGSELALFLLENRITTRRFLHLHARAHHYARYGSQAFLRHLSGLDTDGIISALAIDCEVSQS